MLDAIARVISGEAPWTIEHGEAMDVLRRIHGAGLVAAVITDPPYARTGDSASIVSTKGRARIGKEDQFFESWIREQLIEWGRVLRPDGACWFTIDWRGAVIVDTACDKLGWSQPAVGVWDRGGLGMGYLLRHCYECFCIVSKPNFKRRLTDEPDVWRHEWYPTLRQHGHPGEKPVPLLERALKLITAPGDVVLDPFCGSGTTGVACVRLGRRFIGIEREPAWADLARERIEAEARLSTVADARAGQTVLFPGAPR